MCSVHFSLQVTITSTTAIILIKLAENTLTGISTRYPENASVVSSEQPFDTFFFPQSFYIEIDNSICENARL